mmetsp:Transcript_38023/g.122269  ORF Transcript_38023/g.122269 Transcript_38023/m.122269 type:complete len:211 (-) Transcript_38023:1103-1735(-)
MLLPIRGRPLGRRAVRLPLRLHDTLRLNNRGRWLARAGARRPVGHRGLLVGAVDDEGDHDGDIVGPAPAPHDVVVLGEQREGRVDALVEGELLSTLGDAVGQHLWRGIERSRLHDVEQVVLAHVVEEAVGGQHKHVPKPHRHPHDGGVVWRLKARVGRLARVGGAAELERRVERAKLLWRPEGYMHLALSRPRLERAQRRRGVCPHPSKQ